MLPVAVVTTALLESCGIVIAYLNKVGLVAREPFACPMIV